MRAILPAALEAGTPCSSHPCACALPFIAFLTAHWEDQMAIQVPLDPQHPALRQHAARRSASLQNRVADAITTFAGSMMFVYIHLAWFAIWIVFKVEKYPFGLLTMIVSLEAIFLSTFVMISQNRADAKRQVLADHQWEFVQAEEKQNEQLIVLSNKILDLTTAIHELTVVHGGTPPTS
jgi:uncharacterized membrane protein